MFKTKKQLLFLIIGIVVFVLVVNALLGSFLVSRVSVSKTKNKLSITNVQVKSVDSISYSGKEGIDALSLLARKTSVKQNESGLVVSINNRVADNKKHEFWAFYVNGKFSNVGPKDYVTQDTDKIEWKIDKY